MYKYNTGKSESVKTYQMYLFVLVSTLTGEGVFEMAGRGVR